MKKIFMTALAGLTLTACGGQEAKFVESCEQFSKAQPHEFGDNPKAQCECLYTEVVKTADTEQVTFLTTVFAAMADNEMKGMELVNSPQGDAVESIIENAADTCGL